MSLQDHKRFIDVKANPYFAAEMGRLFELGRIPPFATLFPETQILSILDRDKADKQIIQLGFILTDSKGRVLPYTRTKLVLDKTDAGHRISTGRSVLVGWSPVSPVLGHLIPQSEADIRDALNREVAARIDEPPPQITFLGLIRRNVPLKMGGSTLYYFYLFEARYFGIGPIGESLIKDRDDRLDEQFEPIDDVLIASLDRNKVDLRALEALTGRDLSEYGSNEVDFNCFHTGDIAPFLVRAPGVFFCHSSLDKTFVNDLASRLEAIGIPTWVDKDRLHAGNIWFEEAFEAIRYCQVFLFVASSHSADSIPCRNELAQALARQHWLRSHNASVPYDIIPVTLEGERAETYLPPTLADVHTIDYRDSASREEHIGVLVERIRSIIK